jgi:hypothetical protein
MQITVKKLGDVKLMGDTKAPAGQQAKTTRDLFAERYFQQFGEVRNGGLFGGVHNAQEPEPELEAE